MGSARKVTIVEHVTVGGGGCIVDSSGCGVVHTAESCSREWTRAAPIE